MNYRVIGERTLPNEKVDKHVTEYESYTDAVDYYISVIGSVAEDICDLGGEFVITLIADKSESEFEILKRHVISTTKF
jgi:hypothetical protein